MPLTPTYLYIYMKQNLGMLVLLSHSLLFYVLLSNIYASNFLFSFACYIITAIVPCKHSFSRLQSVVDDYDKFEVDTISMKLSDGLRNLRICYL